MFSFLRCSTRNTSAFGCPRPVVARAKPRASRCGVAFLQQPVAQRDPVQRQELRIAAGERQRQGEGASSAGIASLAQLGDVFLKADILRALRLRYAECLHRLSRADEVELGTLDLIKGLGGALLREKLVAAATTRLAIVVDESKLVDRLAADFRPLPVEVVAFAWQTTARRLESLGAEVTLRLGADGQPFVTDQGNLTLDCRFGAAPPARQLQPRLDATVGVVEHGLFLGMTSLVIVGGAGRVRVLEGRP